MVPSYLVSYEIATNDNAIKIIKNFLSQKKCEVGHHMHVWTTPPFEKPNKFGVDEKWFLGIQSELNDKIFNEKMTNLHNAISENFSIAPTSHRAGRWDLDKRTLMWLIEKNYLVDTTICSQVSWKHTKGVNERVKIESLKAPNFPYFPDNEDITKIGHKNPIKILEVPVTSLKGDFLHKIDLKGRSKIRKVLYKFGYNGIENISFRPTNSLPMKNFERIVHKLYKQDLKVFNFMFHSSELILENSEKIKKKIYLVLKIANEYGIKGITISGLAKIIIGKADH
jgi:hypothetical protein